MTCDTGAHQVVAKHQIGCCSEITHRKRQKCSASKSGHPWTKCKMADLFATRNNQDGQFLALSEHLFRRFFRLIPSHASRMPLLDSLT